MIAVESLTRRYGALVAVDDVSFTVERGDVVGFLGKNGAGKTTTMRILAGSLGATSGRALVGGVDVSANPHAVQRVLGYLPESPPVYPDMVVRDYLRFCARIKRVPTGRDAVEQAIAKTGLVDVAGRLIRHLSKGFRQRVGIAQALVHRPQVLILDEPTSGLDPEQRQGVRALIEQLVADDTTVLLSTHVLAEVEAVCRSVVVIDAGRILAQGPVGELSRSFDLRVVVARPEPGVVAALTAVPGVVGVEPAPGDGAYLVSASADVREQVARAAVEHGLLELSSHASLERAFLDLVHGDAA